MFFVFCGLDGTMADNRARSHLLPPIGSESAQEWKPFHDACRTDLPVPFIMDIAQAFSRIPAVRFVYLTSRPESVRSMTTNWLHHNGAPMLNVPLLMRDDLDTRPGHLYKADMITRQLNTISDDPLNVEFTLIEDNPEICAYIQGVFPRVRIIKPQTFCAIVLRKADVAGDLEAFHPPVETVEPAAQLPGESDLDDLASELSPSSAGSPASQDSASPGLDEFAA
ncbi:HAD family hydrolase [Aeromonas caviae]|uniref:hypothetical protein n=1 Tax=Aeromonas caviae TaxID=648 RepID=UPI0029DA62FB|nr:hypothetical protein [Aeromonas caviae]MDX7711770.1 hypothetical protein [Aeromonas caviae]